MINLVVTGLLMSVIHVQTEKVDLHPLFQKDVAVFRSAYNQGVDFAKRKVPFKKVERTWAKDLGKVRQMDGAHWTAPYAVLMTGITVSQFFGYSDAREYKDSSEFESWLQQQLQVSNTSPERCIHFRACMYAWPGISDFDGSIIKHAREEDVKNLKFVLLIDGKEPIHPIIAPTTLSSGYIQGSQTIPELNTITGTSTSQGSFSVNGSGGTVFGSSSSSTTSNVFYTTYRSEGYTAYIAEYYLLFPMFDKDGKPYVTSNTSKGY